MRPAIRSVLVTLGLAAAVYGTESLTGGWLGTPLWWERPETAAEVRDREAQDPDAWLLQIWGWSSHEHQIDASGHYEPGFLEQGQRQMKDVTVVRVEHLVRRDGREWISGGVVAAGLALGAFGAWPRRRRTERAL